MKIKPFSNIVEHAGSGLKMPEDTARKIDTLSAGLPKDFTYRRLAKSVPAAGLTLDDGERTDVSVITTSDKDRDGEVVLPAGGDWGGYNRIVTFAHQYDQLPAGSNWWIKARGNGLIAKTHYPPKPADWGDAPWLPSAILHLMQQPVPTCTGKSIGFMPLNVRAATALEAREHPEWGGAPIIDKWAGVEYAVAPVPCNPEAEALAVAKCLSGGLIAPDLAEFISQSLKSKTYVLLNPHPQEATMPQADAAPEIEAKTTTESGNGANVVPDQSPAKPKHDYSTAQFNLPPHVCAAMKAMGESIAKNDMDGDSDNDVGDHVTLHYGMHTDDPEDIRKALDGMGPVKFKLGKVAHFPATESRKSDVLHVQAIGKGLHAIKNRLTRLPHSNEFPEYEPHATLAYVKPGAAEKYKDMDGVDGLSVTCNHLNFRDKSGKSTMIQLMGNSEESETEEPDDRYGYTPQPSNGQGTVEQEPEKKSGVSVNSECVVRARKLILAGDVDHGEWTAPAQADRKAEDCLGSGNSYPIIKGDKVYSRGVANAESRGRQYAPAVAAAAKRLSELIAAHESKGFIRAEEKAAAIRRQQEVVKAGVAAMVDSAIIEGLNRARGRV